MDGRTFCDSRIKHFLGTLQVSLKCACGQRRVQAGLICLKLSSELEGRTDANCCKGKEAQPEQGAKQCSGHTSYDLI